MKNMIGGIVAICLGLWGMFAWWASFGLVMRGMVPFCLLILGVLGVVAGFRRMSDDDVEAYEDHDPSERESGSV